MRDSAKGQAGKWTDAATGEHGDLLDVIRESRGLSIFADVVAEAETFLRLPQSRREPEGVDRRAAPTSANPVISAQRLFAAAKPIPVTIVETYLRNYEDERFRERVLHPPELLAPRDRQPDDWSVLQTPVPSQLNLMVEGSDDEDTTGSEQRHQPELARVETVEAPQQSRNEFEIDPVDETEDDVARTSRMTRLVQSVARQASLDPNDGMEL